MKDMKMKGNKESIAIVLLDAPDRDKDHKMYDASPEDYAKEMMNDSYEKKENDPLKEKILELLEPISMPDEIKMEVCEVIYDAVKADIIDDDMAEDDNHNSHNSHNSHNDDDGY